MKVYIDLFGFSIPSYGLMIVAGVILANMIAFMMVRASARNTIKLDYNDLLIVEAYCILGGFLGAKLLYVLVSAREIDWDSIRSLEGFNMFMQSGFVFYGGLIGGVSAVLLVGKLHKIDIKRYVNEFIILIPLVHCFGRIGCFMAGCCYGMPYEGIGAVVFPENSFAIPGIKLFPVQLVEAVGLFCIFVLMLVFKILLRQKNMIQLYCILYGILRFVLEFFRYDSVRGRFWIMSTSQWISLGLVGFALIWIGVKKGE